jgi:hypothetical protein
MADGLVFVIASTKPTEVAKGLIVPGESKSFIPMTDSIGFSIDVLTGRFSMLHLGDDRVIDTIAVTQATFFKRPGTIQVEIDYRAKEKTFFAYAKHSRDNSTLFFQAQTKRKFSLSDNSAWIGVTASTGGLAASQILNNLTLCTSIVNVNAVTTCSNLPRVKISGICAGFLQNYTANITLPQGPIRCENLSVGSEGLSCSPLITPSSELPTGDYNIEIFTLGGVLFEKYPLKVIPHLFSVNETAATLQEGATDLVVKAILGNPPPKNESFSITFDQPNLHCIDLNLQPDLITCTLNQGVAFNNGQLSVNVTIGPGCESRKVSVATIKKRELTPSTPNINADNTIPLSIGVSLGGVVVLLILIFVSFLLFQKFKPKPSVRIEGVEILKKIGGGNFGEVYKGKWQLAEVAVKKLKSKRDTELFEREARLLQYEKD